MLIYIWSICSGFSRKATELIWAEKKEMEKKEGLPLFETKEARFRGVYKLFACSIFAGICLIWVYRLTNIPFPSERGQQRWAWLLVFMSELAFGFYWIITQSARWTIAFHTPFKDALLHRYEEDKLPAVDIFVCTADPILEPPGIVMNTVLSAMSYNYPSSKLSVYLSDDGGSELTFYALFKASIFSKHWIPFCRRFNVEPRSPQAYFATHNSDTHRAQHYLFIKKLYEDMKNDIESAVAKGEVPEDARSQHTGFSEWNPKTTKQDHHSIVQIVIDGRDENAVDEDGYQLPTVVYMAREKRPNYPHNFKAGAMNALIRVSSEISNAPFILNLDCDMYPNNADIIQEVLCFFMDEGKGHEIAYVQFPQNYNNITENDHYANSILVINKIEQAGIGGHGAAMYCGTGCFHRRESLSGTHLKDYKAKRDTRPKFREDKRTINELNQASRALATCSYEQGTQWGKEMGLVYGIPVEDVTTGIPLFPQLTSLWFLPFAYAFVATNGYSLGEAWSCGCTTKGWWNLQRMRLFRRTAPHLLGLIDTVRKQLGLAQTKFVITDKVVTEDVQKRYEKEVIDFGSSSIMLIILVTVALLNLFGLVGGIVKIMMDLELFSQLVMQNLLCAMIVMANLPVYEALIIRSDKGSISFSVMLKSVVLASLLCCLGPFICQSDLPRC